MKINKLPTITHSEGIGAVNIILIEKINELIDAFNELEFRIDKKDWPNLSKRIFEKEEKENYILKYCPFCFEFPIVDGECDESQYWVTCNNDDCELNIRTYPFETKQEAIEAWNKRYT